jgi:hypothetical protein
MVQLLIRFSKDNSVCYEQSDAWTDKKGLVLVKFCNLSVAQNV